MRRILPECLIEQPLPDRSVYFRNSVTRFNTDRFSFAHLHLEDRSLFHSVTDHRFF